MGAAGGPQLIPMGSDQRRRDLGRVAHSVWVDVFVGFRNVVRQRRRTAFNLTAVAFGIAAMILAGGFTEWIFWATREGTIQTTGLGHIQVVRPRFLESGQADPFRFLLPERSSERDLIENSPSVKRVAPRLSFSGLVSHGDATYTFIAEGVDAEAEANLGFVSIIVAGTALAPEDPSGIIVGRGLAKTLGVNVGDTVVLLASTGSGGINAVEAHILGLFSTVSKAYDDSALRTPLPLAHKLLHVSGVHRWVVVLEDTAYTRTAVERLQQILPAASFDIVPWYHLADFYEKMVALLSQQLGIINLIVGIIILLTIWNSLMMSAVERTGEIGTCLAIGVSRAQMLRRFIAEGTTIGLIGGLAGAASGIGLAIAISATGIPMPPPPGGSEAYVAKILVTPQVVGVALALSLVATLIASVAPAWKASRLVIVDALRRNR